jgi:hypothetical protein
MQAAECFRLRFVKPDPVPGRREIPGIDHVPAAVVLAPATALVSVLMQLQEAVIVGDHATVHVILPMLPVDPPHDIVTSLGFNLLQAMVGGTRRMASKLRMGEPEPPQRVNILSMRILAAELVSPHVGSRRRL